MALSVIFFIYAGIGLMAVAGSVFLSRKLFSPRGEQIFFGLFLVTFSAFYLAFTAYSGNEAAWRLEIGGVVVFALLGLVGVRVPAVLIAGYLLHGVWDVFHEMHAHGAGFLLPTGQVVQIPLAYGSFCLAYDGCMAVYFYTRRDQWRAAWRSRAG